MATPYRDPIVAKLIDVLNQHGPAKLKNRYYHGDPLVVAKSQLPAVFISKDKTLIGNESVSEDRHRMPIVINVVQDLTQDFGQAFNNSASAGIVYDAIEGRDPSTYALRSDSIASVLRAYYQLDGPHLYINLDKDLEIDYGVGVEKRGQGIFTVEGVVRLEVYHIELAPFDA